MACYAACGEPSSAEFTEMRLVACKVEKWESHLGGVDPPPPKSFIWGVKLFLGGVKKN